MPKLCSGTLARLSNRPRYEAFRQTVERIFAERGDQIAFMVLFGSMAKGNWLPYSDYDLLIGLNIDDGKRFIDRIGDFQQFEQWMRAGIVQRRERGWKIPARREPER